METPRTNWAGNHTFISTRFHQPTTVDELRQIVAHTGKIRALGSHHSFNDLADSNEQVSLVRMPHSIEFDRDNLMVTVSAGVRYHELSLELERAGFALHNMASLPHITVAGAVATATHGSGDRSGNLSTAVAALELVTADGDLISVARGDEDFDGMVVGIGALGVITTLTLDIEPTYAVRQQIFDHLDWETLFDRFDDVLGATENVSLFTDFGETVNQVWCKSRVDPVNPAPLPDMLLGAAAATQRRNPVHGFSAEHCNEQLGIPGPWHERLPHVRLEGVATIGDQIQSEFMVARKHAVPALKAVRELAPLFQSDLWISEIRTVAPDKLWLSSAYEQETACIHFSFKPDLAAVLRILPRIENALAPFIPRPHWGKLFVATTREIEPAYPRLDDFRTLATRFDPNGKFRNAFLDRCVFN